MGRKRTTDEKAVEGQAKAKGKKSQAADATGLKVHASFTFQLYSFHLSDEYEMNYDYLSATVLLRPCP